MINFGTGGFRGVVGKDFTLDNVYKMTIGLIKYMYRHHLDTITISYDYRKLSYQSALLMAGIIESKGLKALLSREVTTTPVVIFHTRYKGFGVMFTASHNPANYNGIKVFYDGFDADVSLTTELEILINEDIDDLENKKGFLKKVDLLTSYYSFLIGFLDFPKNPTLKVLINPIFGTGAITLKHLVEKLKIVNAVFINNTHDESFGGLNPNPTRKNLLLSADIQKNLNCDLVIGTDSDGDRLGLLDENGNYVDNNEIMACIYYYLVKYRHLQGDIVINIVTSSLLVSLAKKLGFTAHIVDVGFKNISNKMYQTDALIGGESSGGMTFRNYIMGKDSTLSAFLIIEIIEKLKKPLSRIVKEVKEFAEYDKFYEETNYEVKNKENIIGVIMNILPKSHYLKLEILNNTYKYHLANDNFIAFRFSGTEPLLRVTALLENKQTHMEILNKIKETINGKKD